MINYLIYEKELNFSSFFCRCIYFTLFDYNSSTRGRLSGLSSTTTLYRLSSILKISILCPSSPVSLTYLTNSSLLFLCPSLDKTIKALSEVLEKNPRNDRACRLRAQIWGKKGYYDKAISDYNHALKIKPNYYVFLNELAWILATCPDKIYRNGSRALELAKNNLGVAFVPNYLVKELVKNGEIIELPWLQPMLKKVSLIRLFQSNKERYPCWEQEIKKIWIPTKRDLNSIKHTDPGVKNRTWSICSILLRFNM